MSLPALGANAFQGRSAISVRQVLLWVITVGWAFSLGFSAGAYKSHGDPEFVNCGSAVSSAAPCSGPDAVDAVLRESLWNLTQVVDGLKNESERCASDLAACMGNGSSVLPPQKEEPACSTQEKEPACSRPKAAQRIPSSVVQATTDLYLHRIWGLPEEDLPVEPPRNLLVMAVGIKAKVHVDYMIQKFPEENFSVILFHYDGSSLSEWAEYSWSTRAVHVQAHCQGKWWYAKRFLHPDVTAAYEYVFIWDEDLGLDNFNVLRFLDVMRRHSLEMAQPALFPYTQVHHDLTKWVNGSEVHKINPFHPLVLEGHESECIAGKWPPCAGFVEVMAPVFTRKAWACVWYMIQNDLVNGWGLDLQFHACAGGPAHQNMGVIDSEYVEHQPAFTPTPEGDKVFKATGKTFKALVEGRSAVEHELFRDRWHVGLASDWDGPCTSKNDYT